MLWRKKATKLPTAESRGAEGDAHYARTNDKIGERSLLRRQLSASWSQAYAAWANVSVGGLTLAAAFTAALVAVAAFETSVASLTEAQKQSAEAHRQADAAEAQIGVAKDTEKRQLRAYIVITDFSVVCPDCGDDTGGPPWPFRNTVRYKVENSGQTPAYHVRNTSYWITVDEVGPYAVIADDFAYEDVNLVEDKFYGEIDVGRDKNRDSGGEIKAEAIPIFKSAVNKEKSLFIYGHVDYCDIFNEPHSTAFCYRYMPNSDNGHLSCRHFKGNRPAWQMRRRHCKMKVAPLSTNIRLVTRNRAAEAAPST